MANSFIQNYSTPSQDHLFGVAVLLAFILPHSSTLFLLVNPLLCILLIMNFKRQWSSYVFIVVAPILLSVLLNLNIASQKAFFSVFSILLYFGFFPLVGAVRVRNIYLYIILSYILISQLVYLIDIPILTSFFNNAYPADVDDILGIGHMQDTISTNNVFDYRLGGIYHNANNCAEYLCMLLAFYLAFNHNENGSVVLTFCILTYSGVLLTGSRTGFVVATLILFFGLFRKRRYSGISRYVLWGAAIIGLLFFIRSGVSLRGLDVESGFHNSANAKWDTFVYYLKNESNFIALIFGHLDSSLFAMFTGSAIEGYFDCEYGDLIFRFGIVGFFSIMYFWLLTAKRLEKGYRFYFLILLWIISSSVVAAYRACFIFILLLSAIFSNNRVKMPKRIK